MTELDDDADDSRAWAWSSVSALLADPERRVTETLARLCGAGCQSLGMTGAVVTLMSNGSQAVAAAAPPGSRVLAELELELGEGPGRDAYSTGRPVLVPDLGVPSAGPWTRYPAAANHAGLGAIFAFPLHTPSARFGAFSMYADRPRSLARTELRRGSALADLATEILLAGSTRTPDEEFRAELSSTLDVRTEIYQAQGMVMVALQVNLAEALVRMQAHAYGAGLELGDVALEIVAGRLHLSDDQDRP